ncbi:MAG: hypothetical protein EON54_22355 [Alcaligenaceae bacterium]|nr:MAG: hypothetical protein EON54_22355 [Alcaligenaceae bacterium]
MSSPTARLSRLRAAMSAHELAAYVVVSADPHLSEYLPQRWRTRQWLSGFTGSVGTAVVTANEACLWVDSRYWEQAEAELAGSGFALMRAGNEGVPEPGDWLAQSMAPGVSVGIDGHVDIDLLRHSHQVQIAYGRLACFDVIFVDEISMAHPEFMDNALLLFYIAQMLSAKIITKSIVANCDIKLLLNIIIDPFIAIEKSTKSRQR